MGSEEQSLLNELAAQDPSLLDADSIPNENQSLTCFSCEEPMTGLFCYACGNKNDNYRRSVWSLGSELFQSLTAFEGRIWKSFFSLIFKPGRMAREYADGARQKWTSPIRLFLATSLLLFGYIALSGTQIIALGDIETGPDRSKNGINFVADNEDYNQGLLFFVRQSDLKPPPESSMINGFNINFGQNPTPESLRKSIDSLTVQIEETDAEIAKVALTATRDGLINELTELEAEIAASSEAVDDSGEGNLEDADRGVTFNGLSGETVTLTNEGMSELYAQVLRNPAVINNQLNTKLKWAMFFMMPFAMFMGAIFIRGRETAMLYDHLVHAAYVHSFSFLLLFAFILLAQFTSIKWLILWYVAILLIYLPASAKGAFKRGWFKSVLTAYGVGSVYTLIMFCIAVVIVAVALQSVAVDISHRSAGGTQPVIQAYVPET
jgi:hypothetical protein